MKKKHEEKDREVRTIMIIFISMIFLEPKANRI